MGCKELIITDEVLFLEGDPSSKELLPCPDCIGDEAIESIFKTTLRESIMNLPDRELAQSHSPVNMTVAVFVSSSSGVDRQLYEISMTLNFTLHPEAEYSYSNESQMSYHYRVIDGKIMRYSSITANQGRYTPKVSLDLTLDICGFTVKYELV
jgi:hypothetical protein